MQTIVLASGNPGKIKEFKEIFTDYNVLTMKDVGFKDDVEETGTTFKENSMIKAVAIRQYLDNNNLDYSVIADDSGLCVNALGGAPGVYSARYAGDHDVNKNRQFLLDNLKDKEDRSAYFQCCIVMIDKDNHCYIADGRVEGTIIHEPILGSVGFAYDSVFMSKELGLTFTQCTVEQKNAISHRGRAIQDLLQKIKNNDYIQL